MVWPPFKNRIHIILEMLRGELVADNGVQPPGCEGVLGESLPAALTDHTFILERKLSLQRLR